MLEKYADEVFYALYGKVIDKDGIKYSLIHSCEYFSMVCDFHNWFNTMKKYYMPGINETEIASMLILLAQQNIVSNLDIQYDKLHELSKQILRDLCK